MNNLLILFIKNPELGKVKTRLANSIGEGAALAVYFKLLTHTREVADEVDCDKAVFYSQFIDTEDQWDNNLYKKYLQKGKNIGEKMHHAIETGLAMGYDSVCLVGADIYDLTPEVINDAFAKLKSKDVVIGPASDGGYYLIGLKKSCAEIFNLEKWSTSSVLGETIKLVNDSKLTYGLITELNDIDVLEDLRGTDLMI